MDTGMLWFDNNPKSDLPSKIQRAATYYQEKYGKTPDLCFVHPSMLNSNTNPMQGIEIEGNQLVLPHHLWLGIKDQPLAN